MDFTPGTPNEFEAEREAKRLNPGEYDFTIANAVEENGKYGTQIKLELTIHDSNKDKQLTDWVGHREKMYHLCESVGLSDVYARGRVEPSDLQGKYGRVKIKIGKPNDDGKRFPKVEGYLQPVAGETPVKSADIPF